MSFDYDPFRHAEIIKDPKGFHLYCHACGHEWPDGHLQRSNTVGVVFDLYTSHVRLSHDLTPEDTRDWGAI